MNTSGGSLASSFEGITSKISKSIFGGKEIAVGVDVGSSSVKVVELERKEEKLILKNFAVAQGQEELIKPGTSGVINPKAGNMVKKTIEQAGINVSKVNVAVPSFSSLITTIEIPRMPQKEIDKIVQREAPKYIPVQLSDVVYGYQVIDEVIGELPKDAEGKDDKENTKRKKEGNLHILIVAIMKEISDQYDRVFSVGQLGVDSLEIDSFSLTRSLVGEDPTPYLILDIGHKVCNIVAVSNKNILLNRTIDIAGDRITRVVAKTLNVTNDRAEKMKLQHGMDIDQEVKKMIAQVLSVLASEVKKTISALAESYPEVEIQGVILSGGGSKLKGLNEFIQKELGLNTTLGDPLKSISYPTQIKKVIKENGPALSIATGLALLGFEDKN